MSLRDKMYVILKSLFYWHFTDRGYANLITLLEIKEREMGLMQTLVS